MSGTYCPLGSGTVECACTKLANTRTLAPPQTVLWGVWSMYRMYPYTK